MSDQTQPTWIARFVAPLVHVFAWFLLLSAPKHVRAFLNTREVPTHGPLIVVANHRSYFDGQLLALLFWMLWNRRLRSVSNVKAFRGLLTKLYYELVGDVRVDPRDPEATYTRLSAELAADGVLLMYPEGHRSPPGGDFLRFHYGAFNLAIAHDVPVLPVGLRDTELVLPKGAIRYRAGATAAAYFGALLRPAEFLAQAANDARDAARLMCDRAEAVLRELVHGDESVLATAETLLNEARAVGLRVRDELELLLDRGAETIGVRESLRVLRIARAGRMLPVHCPELETQYVRAYGFFVGALPKLVTAFLLAGFRRMITARLAEDPRDPYANYVLGQYELQVPRILGGDRELALSSMRAAYGNAESRALLPSRFAVGFATALFTVGRGDEAKQLLARHFENGPEGPSERLARRFERAQRLLAANGEPQIAPSIVPTQGDVAP